MARALGFERARRMGTAAAAIGILMSGCGGGGGGEPTNPNNQNPAVTVPASYVSGTWGGQAARRQLGASPYPAAITFSGVNSVKAGSDMATVSYGPFGGGLVGTCAGTLVFLSLSGATLTLSERISAGPCVHLGTVSLTYDADPPTRITYAWAGPVAGYDTGTLTRR